MKNLIEEDKMTEAGKQKARELAYKFRDLLVDELEKDDEITSNREKAAVSITAATMLLAACVAVTEVHDEADFLEDVQNSFVAIYHELREQLGKNDFPSAS